MSYGKDIKDIRSNSPKGIEQTVAKKSAPKEAGELKETATDKVTAPKKAKKTK